MLHLQHLRSSQLLEAAPPELRDSHLQEYGRQVSERAKYLSELYQLGMQLLDLELEMPRNEYRLLLPCRIPSAAIPSVKTVDALGIEADSKGLVRSVYRGLLKHVARDTLKPVIEILTAAVANGASRLLLIGSASGLATDPINRVARSHVEVSTAGMMTGNFAKAFETPPKFDVCIWDLDFAELLEFPALVPAVRPFMAARGIIIGYHLNQTLSVLPSGLVPTAGLGAEDVARIHYTGSWMSARVLASLRNIAYVFASRQYHKLPALILKSAAVLAVATPIVLLTRGTEARPTRRPIAATNPGDSIVIEIVTGPDTELSSQP
jgi:hypothetical protein